MKDDERKVNVTAQIRRTIGQDELIITATGLVPIGSEAFEFNRLYGCLRTAMVDYIDNVLPTMPLNPVSISTSANGAEWILITRLSVTVDKGKRYVKAHGGPFEKFGVVVWPEVAKTVGWDLNKVPDAGLLPTKVSHMAITKDDKGKPRITAIRVTENETPNV